MTRERQLIEAEVARLEHVRPSAEPTIQRAIDDRIVALKQRLERLAGPVVQYVEGHDA